MNIKVKKWPYGTTIDVVVISYQLHILAVIDPVTKEGFILVEPQLNHEPKAGDRGKIIFKPDQSIGRFYYYQQH